MAFNTATAGDDPFMSHVGWKGGAIAGLLSTVIMGVAITVMNAGVLQASIAGLYAQEGNLIAGWLAHLVHGTLFGVLFAVVMADPSLAKIATIPWKSAIAGVIYGILLAVIGAGIIMPIWLGAIGFGDVRPILQLNPPLLFWHLLYGIVLGGAFPFLHKW